MVKNQLLVDIKFHRNTEHHWLDFPKTLEILLSKIVGRENLSFSKSDRQLYSRTTLSKGTTPTCIVQPSCKQEIQQIILLANEYQLKIFPISTGKNWGYSDRCAISDNHIILDLSRMNKVISFDNDLGTITVEPGVTQGQVSEFLIQNNLPFFIDATGAGPDTSLIGNTVERGFGHSPNGDRYANSCNYEVVLPNGDCIQTGFGRFENSKVNHVYKWGIGPVLDGIFTQSNFGIVTQMTFWLFPKPEYFSVVAFSLKSEEDIDSFIERIRPLRMDGTIRSIVHIANDLRFISMVQSCPHNLEEKSTFIDKKTRQAILKKNKMGYWSGTIGFYGDINQVRADLKKFKRSLKGYSGIERLIVLNERTLKISKALINSFSAFGLFKNFIPMLEKAELGFNLLKGQSSNQFLKSCLWRINRDAEVKSVDPLDHRVGMYWISPVLPMKGRDVKILQELIEPIFNKYGFDYLQTISLTTERAMTSVLTINFDKENGIQCEKAKQCHNETVEALFNYGYNIYRAGNHSMKFFAEDDNAYNDFLHVLKNAIDPNGVLAPGKYVN